MRSLPSDQDRKSEYIMPQAKFSLFSFYRDRIVLHIVTSSFEPKNQSTLRVLGLSKKHCVTRSNFDLTPNSKLQLYFKISSR